MHPPRKIFFTNILNILTNMLGLYHTEHDLILRTHRNCLNIHDNFHTLSICTVPIEHRYVENIHDCPDCVKHQIRVITAGKEDDTTAKDYIITERYIYQSNEDRFETPQKSYMIKKVVFNDVYTYVQDKLDELFVN